MNAEAAVDSAVAVDEVPAEETALAASTAAFVLAALTLAS